MRVSDCRSYLTLKWVLKLQMKKKNEDHILATEDFKIKERFICRYVLKGHTYSQCWQFGVYSCCTSQPSASYHPTHRTTLKDSNSSGSTLHNSAINMEKILLFLKFLTQCMTDLLIHKHIIVRECNMIEKRTVLKNHAQQNCCR